MLLTACVCFAVLTYPLFLLLNAGSLVAAILAHIALGILQALFISTSVAALTELFCDNLRRWLDGQPLRNLYSREKGY